MSQEVTKNENALLDLITELDAGMLHPLMEKMARNAALGVYMADNSSVKGELCLKLKIGQIKGTGQLMLESELSTAVPTLKGKTTELIKGETAVHVSMTDRGAMTIMPDTQMKLLEDQ